MSTAVLNDLVREPFLVQPRLFVVESVALVEDPFDSEGSGGDKGDDDDDHGVDVRSTTTFSSDDDDDDTDELDVLTVTASFSFAL